MCISILRSLAAGYLEQLDKCILGLASSDQLPGQLRSILGSIVLYELVR